MVKRNHRWLLVRQDANSGLYSVKARHFVGPTIHPNSLPERFCGTINTSHYICLCFWGTTAILYPSLVRKTLKIGWFKWMNKLLMLLFLCGGQSPRRADGATWVHPKRSATACDSQTRDNTLCCSEPLPLYNVTGHMVFKQWEGETLNAKLTDTRECEVFKAHDFCKFLSRAGWHHLACPLKMRLGITYYITCTQYIFI